MADTDWRTALRDGAVVEVKRKRDKTDKTDKTKDMENGKKKPKYSPGLMSMLGVAERRIASGLAAGSAEYLRLSQKAAEGAPDGAVLGAAKNLVRAQEKAVKQVSKLPSDLSKGPDFKRASKRARRITRLLAW